MKILNISLDRQALDPNSLTAQRLRSYGQLVDKYVVVVPSSSRQIVELSDRVKVYGSGGRNRAIQLFNVYRAGRRILSQEKFSVITSQDPFETALVGWLLARRFGLGLNIQEHGDFFSAPYWRREKLLHFVRYWLGRFLLKRADSVRVVSRRIARTLAGLGIAADKIVAVPVYTPPPNLISVQPASWRPEFAGQFVFLTMARLVRQKNLSLLLRAFKLTASKAPQAVLVIVGSGPLAGRLKALSRRLGLAGKVFFHPWTDDVYAYYLAADAYVLSSNYEGWGRVIIEAAYAGLPVIMTDVGCAGEIIKDGQSGAVVPVGDQPALAQAMVKMAKDSHWRQQLARGAQAAVKNLPNQEETLRLYLKSWQLAMVKT